MFDGIFDFFFFLLAYFLKERGMGSYHQRSERFLNRHSAEIHDTPDSNPLHDIFKPKLSKKKYFTYRYILSSCIFLGALQVSFLFAWPSFCFIFGFFQGTWDPTTKDLNAF